MKCMCLLTQGQYFIQQCPISFWTKPIPFKSWPANPAYKLVNFLSASHIPALENVGSALPMVPPASLRKTKHRNKWEKVLGIIFSYWELMSPYHYPNDMNEYSCFVWWEERRIRKLIKGDEGWKPNRTATKSLGGKIILCCSTTTIPTDVGKLRKERGL